MHYLLIAHVGLQNMLGKANEPTLTEQLQNRSNHQLQTWLRLVDREGNVPGLVPLRD